LKPDRHGHPGCLVWKKLRLYAFARTEKVKLTDAQKREHAELYQAVESQGGGRGGFGGFELSSLAMFG
jgi:hypothetical protein